MMKSLAGSAEGRTFAPAFGNEKPPWAEAKGDEERDL